MIGVLPELAISVRQPWAWALIHGGKDAENRPLFAPWRPLIGKHVAIHASKGMTRAEYVEARDFMDVLGVRCPPAGELRRGGIIGSVRVVDVVERSRSPWFFGPCGIVVDEPMAAPGGGIPCGGQLGVFRWRQKPGEDFEAFKPWMMKAEIYAGRQR